MTTNRWLIALAGVLMQIALGAVYAWSVFRNPLIKAHGWSIPDVTLTLYHDAILRASARGSPTGGFVGRVNDAAV